ncbi:hypothetical protein [Xylanimonas cellulosilytica]|uniref:hypothetical protein n=1 Tax=Xylanimonas cellulosilytica TaxID=186189 RepID=UPI001C9DB06E|nr:hypothetical protein [Xylanimonas cellulosilytica]
MGGSTCKVHGSGTKAAREAAARRVEEERARAAVVTLGLPADVSPTEALLEEVRWTAGHVQWLRTKVQELDEAPVDPLTDGTTSALVWGMTKRKIGGDDGGDTFEAKPSIWYALYESERKHLVAVCAAAIKAGVEERKVRLAEQQGDLVAMVIRRILDDLHLTVEQQQLVPDVVPRHLRAIAGGAA